MEKIQLAKFLNDDWKKVLQTEFTKSYYQTLEEKVNNAYQTKTVYPTMNYVFEALNKTPFKEVKVVIIGQDPYHNIHQANGLCFSVNKQVKIPPSLKNIIKELKQDVNISEPLHGDLTHWAKEGVLLLNSVLTVEAHQPNSHKNFGWELFTDAILHKLAMYHNHLVFLLWGARAAKKVSLINQTNHKLLLAKHPSPLSAYRGFFGCAHFSRTNAYLELHHKKPINWEII